MEISRGPFFRQVVSETTYLVYLGRAEKKFVFTFFRGHALELFCTPLFSGRFAHVREVRHKIYFV